ncbi:MAG: AmmeMemoRadiSam system protein A [Candidatus Micrarchaeia archaeon]
MPSMNEYNKKEKGYLLNLARSSIENYLKTEKIIDPDPGEIPSKKLVENGACFVSLHNRKNNSLRGCIGMLEATRPLVLDVVNNAVSAAFEDPRFKPLTLEELKDIKISISILTKPVEIEIKDYKDLLKKLVPKKHGVIIQRGWSRATFLPVVWEELKTKEEFLSHLCMKAGLMGDEWKKPGMKFFFYEAVEFEE